MAMKLQFKHQQFQEDAAKAVVDVFEGQPKLSREFLVDLGKRQLEVNETKEIFGYGNHSIIITKDSILEHIKRIQRNNLIEPSQELIGQYNLTIEMETGVGKTYTYIKTIYELNKKYGWNKFIIVVPSVAIREGVNKSFEITKEHFKEEYGKELRFFKYDSANLSKLKVFERDSGIEVMIINSGAFNAQGKIKGGNEARRIYMKLDEFESRRPIDAITSTRPIIIIDEPQSVEGAETKKGLEGFNPLFTLRYSATPKEQYNLIYRLDALEAYNKQIVKKIAVKGIQQKGDATSEGYVYLEKVNVFKDKNPTATIHHYIKNKNAVTVKKFIVSENYNIYDKSDKIEAYKDGYVITNIDGRDNSITLGTNLKLYEGDEIGNPSDEIKRRIQIRETITTHLKRECELYKKGIKVLSLFFIDEVAKYKSYVDGKEEKGIYAKLFEEEYKEAVKELEIELENTLGEDSYLKYLKNIKADTTHSGYFSIDKKGHATDSKIKNEEEKTSDDTDAYDLIMKDKERLLSFSEPVRFIFSHSALREGWDNPNVFQICTLKQSGSDVRKRQEVGRGMRLCVNQNGVRMDASSCDEKVHDINILTIIASESYDKFADSLQKEISDDISDRPKEVIADLFINKHITDNNGIEITIDRDIADEINENLITNGYVKKRVLTDKFFEDKKNGEVTFSDEIKNYSNGILRILDTVYNNALYEVDNARSPKNIELKLSEEKYNKAEFQELWKRINKKSAYYVDFDTDELIKKAVDEINEHLTVSKPSFEIVDGVLKIGESKESLLAGTAMEKTPNGTHTINVNEVYKNNIKYDLIGKIVDLTDLTRKTVAEILMKITPDSFSKFKINPEEFIIKISNLINEQKANVIIEHITYNILDDSYQKNVFTDTTIKGKLGKNAMPAEKHLYNYIVCDSQNEMHFAEELEAHTEVIVYVKLPGNFYISTPLGKYQPDWAIAFREGTIKHIYFVAETKGSLSTLDLRSIEKGKIECAKKHFKAISGDNIKYDVVDSYESMINILNDNKISEN